MKQNKKYIDESKNLGKCAHIQNIEYNEQIIQIGRELDKRDDKIFNYQNAHKYNRYKMR